MAMRSDMTPEERRDDDLQREMVEAGEAYLMGLDPVVEAPYFLLDLDKEELALVQRLLADEVHLTGQLVKDAEYHVTLALIRRINLYLEAP